MNSNRMSAVLKQEQELLEEILTLAECQPDLLASGRAEDLEILLTLRAGPLSRLAAVEEAAQVNDPLPATTEELKELNNLNLSILSLVDRIVDLDEKTGWLVDQYDSWEPPEVGTEPGRAVENTSGGKFD